MVLRRELPEPRQEDQHEERRRHRAYGQQQGVGAEEAERPLDEMQENTVKIQLALPEERSLPEDLELLHLTETGRLKTLILRGRAEELTAKLAACEPFFMDVLPLSLEEIFIYELGGAEHEIRNILL